MALTSHDRSSGSGPIPPKALRITCQHEKGFAVVALTGDLDMSTSAEFTEQVDDALERRPSRLLVDASGLSFADSAGLKAIVNAHSDAQTRGIDLRVVDTSPQVRRTIDMAGLTDLLGVGDR